MKIDGGGVPLNISGITNINELAEKLNVGEVFRAKIIEITTSDVLLKLFDGTKITALQGEPINASLGEFADFEVKSNQGNNITIVPAKSTPTTTNISEIDKILLNFGKTDSDSKQVAKALADNGIKITSDTIDNIKNQISEFKAFNLTPAKAVFLMQNDVPINKENINLLNSFLNKEFNLVGKLESLTSELSRLPQAKVSEIHNKLSILESMEKLPEIITKLAKLDETLNSTLNSSKDTKNSIEQMGNQAKANSQAVTTDNLQINNTKSQNNTGSLNNFNSEKNPETKLDNLIENSVLLTKKNPSEIINTDIENLENLKKLLVKIKNPENHSLENTQSTIDKNKDSSPEEVLKKIFDSCFIKLTDKLSPDDIDVKDVYKKILHRLSVIKEVTENLNDNSSTEIKTNISNFDKQLNFLNDINTTNNTFVQVPLNYEGYKNGELYIIKKKNANKSGSQDGTTMFLSLGTVNIGRFETLVNVKDKNIKVYIRLENEELINFVKNNYNMLYDLVNKSPYKIVDIKCKKIDEEIDPMNLQTALKNEFIGDTKSIDYKI
jgi:hypothetical protein